MKTFPKLFALKLKKRLNKIHLVINLMMRGGEEDMALVYATLIQKGLRTFDSVHDVQKQAVAQVLIDLELDYLITDAKYLPK